MERIQDITSPMTAMEKRATFSLASIFALRMLGLFMLLPVLSLFAEGLPDATPMLTGLAISIYGLTQALLQIPFGLLSDRFGRKKIIVIGLILFASGSVVAALSTSIYGILIGRALQGGGAIAAAIMALVADLTQEVHRTKAMASIGASIGLSFGIAMTAGPLLAASIGIHGIFWLTAGLSSVAILIVLFVVPSPERLTTHCDAELIPSQFTRVIKSPDLLRLDYGIFVLHLVLTAIFVVLPLQLRDNGILPDQHWLVYLPLLLTSMAAIIPFVIMAEKKRKMKPVFLAAIGCLVAGSLGMSVTLEHNVLLLIFLWLFFAGFNLLEATLPSLVSKTAPADLKGTAMGAYSSSQFLGAFLGGVCAGGLYGEWGMSAVFAFSAFISFTWLLIASRMRPPRYLSNLLLSLDNVTPRQENQFTEKLLALDGIKEVKLHFEENTAYLKVDNNQLDKQQLQQFLIHWQ